MKLKLKFEAEVLDPAAKWFLFSRVTSLDLTFLAPNLMLIPHLYVGQALEQHAVLRRYYSLGLHDGRIPTSALQWRLAL